MSSRDKILQQVKANQPEQRELPGMPVIDTFADPAARFVSTLEAIGGKAYIVSGYSRIASIVHEEFADAKRIVNGIPELGPLAGKSEDPHTLENVDLAILKAHFGVAENGACWVTEDLMIERALPFITQHLALVVHKKDVVSHMQEAYERIAAIEAANGIPGFATFIAGPSKTADIEQSLVLGAHGPRSMTLFLIDEELSDAGFY